MQALLAIAPVRPDFHFCDQVFSNYRGSFQLADCLQAEALMPRGTHALRYHQAPPPFDPHEFDNLDRVFPVVYRHGMEKSRPKKMSRFLSHLPV